MAQIRFLPLKLKALLGFYGLNSFNYPWFETNYSILENDSNEQENVNLNDEENLKVDEETACGPFSKSFETEIVHLMKNNLSYSSNRF